MALQRGAYGGAQIKGSIGSQTYQAGPYGQIIRSRTVPVNPNTPAQASIRALMAFYSQYWNDSLSAAQRDGWAAYAVATPLPNRFGESRNIGGRQMFLRQAITLTAMTGAPADDAPALPGVPAVPALTFGVSIATGFEVTTVAPALTANDYLTIQASVPMNPSRNYYSGPWRAVNTLNFLTTYPATIALPIAPVAGQRYFLRYRIANLTGKVSSFVQGTFDLVA